MSDQPSTEDTPANSATAIARAARRHFAIGWWGLFAAMLGGLFVDALLGLKLEVYLDVQNQTRRLMWRLAHAHAAGLSLVQLGLATYLSSSVDRWTTTLRAASSLSIVGLIAMPTGFALGGAQLYGDDPGLGVFLAPVGGLAVTLATGCIALNTLKPSVPAPSLPKNTESSHKESPGGADRKRGRDARR